MDSGVKSLKKKDKRSYRSIVRSITPIVPTPKAFVVSLWYSTGKWSVNLRPVVAASMSLRDTYSKVGCKHYEFEGQTHREMLREGYYFTGRHTEIVWTFREQGEFVTRRVEAGDWYHSPREEELSLCDNEVTDIWFGEVNDLHLNEEFVRRVKEMAEVLNQEAEGTPFTMPVEIEVCQP